MNISDLRRNYSHSELRRAGLADDPFRQFEEWFHVALGTPEIAEPNAMTLATASSDGVVTARIVLLKSWAREGFIFFTNYGSVKARQIEENPQVALLFAWLPLERQISITGRAEKVSREESLAYFASRPFASRIGACVSPQSRVIESREVLESRFAELQQQCDNGEVPLPDTWGGYRVVPQTIEFWQGRADRLHDRFLYSTGEDRDWKIERLAP